MKDIKEKMAYISLKEAAKHCNYSQDYLKLRARQGKLRATKIGRNWTTRREWLEEYLKKVEESSGQKYTPLPRFNPFPFLLYTLLTILLATGGFFTFQYLDSQTSVGYTRGVFRDYIQWLNLQVKDVSMAEVKEFQAANFSEIFNKKFLKIVIPERTIEIKIEHVRFREIDR